MIHRTVRHVSTALVAVLALGCSNSEPMTTAPEDRFVVTPLFIGLDPGGTQQMRATLGGQPVPVTWASETPTVATVSATGLVTAITSGFSAITATMTANPSRLFSGNVTVVAGLVNGVATSAISSSGARGSGIRRFIVVPPGKTSLTITLSGGTGDPDLYVRQGTPPTSSSNSCASEGGGGATETCTFANPAPGVWHILIELWDPYANYVLRATYAPA